MDETWIKHRWNKLKSLKVAKWRKDEWIMIKVDEGWMKNHEGWMIRDDDFKLLRGFADEQTNGQMNRRTDICDCRVAFTTENKFHIHQALMFEYRIV